MCRLKKSEWFEKDMNKRANDTSYKCTYQHPQGLPDIQLTTGEIDLIVLEILNVK